LTSLAIAVFLILSFWITRGSRRWVRPILWFIVGASLGPYLLDSTSLVSRARVFWWDHQRSDQIEVPSVMPQPLGMPVLFVEYPGGNRIMTRQPMWGEALKDITLFYRMETGELQLSCSPLGRRADLFVSLVISSERRPIILTLEGTNRRLEISGELEADAQQGRSDWRLLLVKGYDVVRLLEMLGDTPFPAKVELSVQLAGTDKPVVSDRIWTTGTVQPLSDVGHAQLPQPRSNPFRVMQTFCSTPPS
jgi:hypothetical protein